MKGERFPIKLHRILEDAEARGFEDIIGWCPGGKSFVVRNKVRLQREVMSYYFASDKFKSFQRSLNLWGFQKRKKKNSPSLMTNHLVEQQEEGYCHPLFIRGKLELCDHMLREKIKQPGTRNHLREETGRAAVAEAMIDKWKEKVTTGASSSTRSTTRTTGEKEDDVAPVLTRPRPHASYYSMKEIMTKQEEERLQQLSKEEVQRKAKIVMGIGGVVVGTPPRTTTTRTTCSSVMSNSRGCPPTMTSAIQERLKKEDNTNKIITAMMIQAQIKSSLPGCAFPPPGASPVLPPPPTFLSSTGARCPQQQQLLLQNFPESSYVCNDPSTRILSSLIAGVHYRNDVSFGTCNGASSSTSFMMYGGFPQVTRGEGEGSVTKMTTSSSSSSSRERVWNNLALEGLMVRLLSHYTKERGTSTVDG